MDHDDARFVADALESRIAGDRDALDRLAETCVIRLAAAASRLKRLGAEWPPALLAALELETIARYGAKAADGDPLPDLKIFVDKLREISAEPAHARAAAPPRNRFERRQGGSGRTALKQRRARILVARRGATLH